MIKSIPIPLCFLILSLCGCGDSDSKSSGTDTSSATDTEHDTEYDTANDTEADIPVSSVLTPFDANESDIVGPSAWATNYGKIPEIIVASTGTELSVLAQDYDSDSRHVAVLLHIKRLFGHYQVTQALTDLPMLDRVMGLAIDSSGNRYYATGVAEDERVDSEYPPLNTYRENIMRVVKVDSKGKVQFNIDLDIARGAFDDEAEMVINPMTAASSRLAVGGGEIAVLHGINTEPDWNIEGRRHQKALSTRLSASDGAITRVSSVWCSHSFDQRLIFDGQNLIENHLGDSYPRQIVFSPDHKAHPLFWIKGRQGENNTRTRLGNVALIENDSPYRYIAVFSSESTVEFGDTINGPRNVAMVRVHSSKYTIDPNLPDSLTVQSSGDQKNNPLKWITDYNTSANRHAERPKLIAIGDDHFVVLWEEWQFASGDTFNGVYGTVIDAMGQTLQSATLITKAHHLHRGDDAFFLNDTAAWMTGSASSKELILHLVDAKLNYEMIRLD